MNQKIRNSPLDCTIRRISEINQLKKDDVENRVILTSAALTNFETAVKNVKSLQDCENIIAVSHGMKRLVLNKAQKKWWRDIVKSFAKKRSSLQNKTRKSGEKASVTHLPQSANAIALSKWGVPGKSVKN